MARRGAGRISDGKRSGRGASDRRHGRPDGAGSGAALGGVERKWPVAAPAGRRMEQNGSAAMPTSAVWHGRQLPLPIGS